MITNVYSRLRKILAPPPLQLVQIVTINGDGTSLVTYPQGSPTTPYAPGLSAGANVRVRGDSVAVGGHAWVRSGVIESAAPSSALSEAVIGSVVALPFGPAPVSLPNPVGAQTGTTGSAFSLNLAAFIRDGWAPFTFTMVSGTLPPGLTLNSAGVISGTPTAAGSYSPVLQVEDSTHVVLSLGTVAFTIT